MASPQLDSVIFTAARHASTDPTEGPLVAEATALTPEARRLDRDLTKAAVSAEMVSAMQKRASDHLGQMERTAADLKKCDVGSFANASDVAPVSAASFHAASDTELFVCPPARLAFVHIFKCAGTTVIASMHDLCRATYGVDGFCVTAGAPWVCRGGPTRTMEEEWPNLQQYAWFTFVRDPVSKFESGVFELARRGAPCVLDAGANREGDELALNVLESCVLSKDRREEVDPHLRPSISYLLEPAMTVSPLLSHVGRVEAFVDDWPALVTNFFDATKGAQVRELLLNNSLHERDSNEDAYAADAPEKFNLQIASKRARSTVEQAFHADEMCLGYARRPQEKFRCVLDGC